MKRTLIYIAVIVAQLIIVYLGYPFFLDFIFSICKTCVFLDDIGPAGILSSTLFFSILYSAISFYLNIKTEKEVKTRSCFFLIVLTLLDMILVPVTMALALGYFMTKDMSSIPLSKIYNIFIVTFVILIKHIIILAINDFIIKPKKAIKENR